MMVSPFKAKMRREENEKEDVNILVWIKQQQQPTRELASLADQKEQSSYAICEHSTNSLRLCLRNFAATKINQSVGWDVAENELLYTAAVVLIYLSLAKTENLALMKKQEEEIQKRID